MSALDPRIAELDCLNQLARDSQLQFTLPLGSSGGAFGLLSGPLREMLAEFIEQGFVNGNATAMADDRSTDSASNLAMLSRIQDLNDLRLGRPLLLRISHKGRVRLWRLRDELRANDMREQFGILWDRRAWDRELRVQLLFASAEEPLSILFLDLDHFKKVNDTHWASRGRPISENIYGEREGSCRGPRLSVGR